VDADLRGPARTGWPLWVGPTAFISAFGAVSAFALLLAGVLQGLGFDVDGDGPPGYLVGTTLAQSILLVGTVLLACRLVRGRPEALVGLGPMPLRDLAKAVGLGAVAMYVVLGLYTLLVTAEGEQDTLEQLGVRESSALLVLAAFLVVVVAPVVEEVFFRGLFYGSLRSRLSPLLATAGTGALFGAIHFTGTDTLPLLPLLAWVGVVWCVLYERTGRLWPAIALHAVNNALAVAATADAPGAVAAALGALGVVLGLVALGASRGLSAYRR
jgi:uncharacterized protein